MFKVFAIIHFIHYFFLKISNIFLKSIVFFINRLEVGSSFDFGVLPFEHLLKLSKFQM